MVLIMAQKANPKRKLKTPKISKKYLPSIVKMVRTYLLLPTLPQHNPNVHQVLKED